MKPINHVLIAHFYNRHNESTENHKNTNSYDGFSEDVGIENSEYEEALVKQNIRDEKNHVKQIMKK